MIRFGTLLLLALVALAMWLLQRPRNYYWGWHLKSGKFISLSIEFPWARRSRLQTLGFLIAGNPVKGYQYFSVAGDLLLVTFSLRVEDTQDEDEFEF